MIAAEIGYIGADEQQVYSSSGPINTLTSIVAEPGRTRQRQDMVARQRREMNIGRRCRIDPDCFIDLLAGHNLPFHLNAIESGLNAKAGLVRSGRIVGAERMLIVSVSNSRPRLVSRTN